MCVGVEGTVVAFAIAKRDMEVEKHFHLF